VNKLLCLENNFQDYLLHGHPAILQSVAGTTKVPTEVRLAIYGDAYRSRLHEALSANYSILEKYLGYEQFQALCYAYIDEYPSSFRSIRWFGDQLDAFLRQHPIYKDYPYLAEFAQFEWTMTLLFDAEDGQAMSIDMMQTVPPEAWMNMRFEAHPSIKRLSLSWNVVPIWQAVNEEQTPEEPYQYESPLSWLLWRNGLMTHFSSLKGNEAWAVNAMIDSSTFGDICEGLCQWVGEDKVGEYAASLLKGWIIAGLITKVIV
jgi:hypothetical protein